MRKPTIFFSHSSRDKEVMQRLKNLFLEKTGGTIEVFLSSDGQSIPLGRNWVHRVQEGLENAALLIVFLTPNSVGSNWVYFEAGFSYCKGIRVVPAGFLGSDITQMKPPISLLQGFNINSADTLNNIIALTNEVFKHSHKPTFSESNYLDIIGGHSDSDGQRYHEALRLVDDVIFSLSPIQQHDRTAATLLHEIHDFLKNQNIECQFMQHSIRLRGVLFNVKDSSARGSIEITIDSFALENNLPILQKVIGMIPGSRNKVHYLFRLRQGLGALV